jgi:hypothetical protein
MEIMSLKASIGIFSAAIDMCFPDNFFLNALPHCVGRLIRLPKHFNRRVQINNNDSDL